MNIAIYCRVSTKLQTTINQEQFVKEYVQRLGHKIYRTYTDVYTGASDSRPHFDKLLSAMRKHEFDTIAVYKLDRIGRSLKHLLQLFEEFNKHKITFISCTQNIDTSTPEGRMMLQMLMVLAEYERELTRARINDTIGSYKEQLKEKGQFITRDGKICKKLGRPKGRKDTTPRNKSGYYVRWAKKSSLSKTDVQP